MFKETKVREQLALLKEIKATSHRHSQSPGPEEFLDGITNTLFVKQHLFGLWWSFKYLLNKKQIYLQNYEEWDLKEAKVTLIFP